MNGLERNDIQNLFLAMKSRCCCEKLLLKVDPKLLRTTSSYCEHPYDASYPRHRLMIVVFVLF